MLVVFNIDIFYLRKYFFQSVKHLVVLLGVLGLALWLFSFNLWLDSPSSFSFSMYHLLSFIKFLLPIKKKKVKHLG